MFDDRIEVRSPGLLPEPVTIGRLLKRERIHTSRNPLIVRVLTDLGYMREMGEGIPRMFEEMEKNGLYPPELRIEADSIFTVVLKNQPMYSREDMEWLEQFRSYSLSPNQKRMLLYGRARGGSFTSRTYQKICGVGIYEASREMRDMIQKGILKLRRKGGRIYDIIMPGEIKKLKVPEEFHVLKPILREKGWISNRDIRVALQISRAQASRVAKSLVEKGLLVPEGKGRGAKYNEAKKKNESI